LHHLVKSNETLGAMLLSGINVAYYQKLMSGVRDAVAAGAFAAFCAGAREGWAKGDVPAR
jgi:queuine tRNA-ribosyltransferase